MVAVESVSELNAWMDGYDSHGINIILYLSQFRTRQFINLNEKSLVSLIKRFGCMCVCVFWDPVVFPSDFRPHSNTISI